MSSDKSIDKELRDLERYVLATGDPEAMVLLELKRKRAGKPNVLSCLEYPLSIEPWSRQITMQMIRDALGTLFKKKERAWYVIAGTRDYMHEKVDKSPLVLIVNSYALEPRPEEGYVTIGFGQHFLSNPYAESCWSEELKSTIPDEHVTMPEYGGQRIACRFGRLTEMSSNWAQSKKGNDIIHRVAHHKRTGDSAQNDITYFCYGERFTRRYEDEYNTLMRLVTNWSLKDAPDRCLMPRPLAEAIADGRLA